MGIPAVPASLDEPLPPPLPDALPQRRRVVGWSVATIVVIAAVDWKVQPNVSLGFLYILPMLVLATFASRPAMVALALGCSALREVLGPFVWEGATLIRLGLGFAGFLGAGWFASELARLRRLAEAQTQRLGAEIARRLEVEEEMRVLVESSPAAILTLNGEGVVLLANEAAHRLLASEDRRLAGQSIEPRLPALLTAIGRKRGLLRTSMECMGRRCDGEVFLAHVWFSTYHTLAGSRLAAIVLDASEQLHEREVRGLDSVAAASRVLFAAVSHEVRNLSAAAAVAHANLARRPELAGDADLRALGTLVQGLEKIASSDLRRQRRPDLVKRLELSSLLDELRVVLERAMREDGIELEWDVPAALPPVVGEAQGLMQVFLNLARNSQREIAGRPGARLHVGAAAREGGVEVAFEDNGPGVSRPEILFRPFAAGREAAGLGLFVSRTIVRSYAGDLRHEPGGGSRFVVSLAAASGR